MSRATSAVVMLGRRSGCAAAHASAYFSERFSHIDSRASVLGTYGGRSPWKYFGMHESAGRLEPTPRGSKPTQSYALPASFGMNWPRIDKVRPDPPGPPGFTSMTP